MSTREVHGAGESASRCGLAPRSAADRFGRESSEGADRFGRESSEGADRFGRAVAARLQAGADDLPHDVRERLRAARAQALARRKRETVLNAAPGMQANGGAATLGSGGLGWWGRIASALPLLALAAGLVLLHSVQGDERAAEIAEVDAALLTDDLPPSAYADPGFVQFLKLGRE